MPGDLALLPRRARARGGEAPERRPAPADEGRRGGGPAVLDRVRRLELRGRRQGRGRAARRDAPERARARAAQAPRRGLRGDDPRRGRGRARHRPQWDHGARRRARAGNAARATSCRSSRRFSTSSRPATAPTSSASTASPARWPRCSAASSCRCRRATLAHAGEEQVDVRIDDLERCPRYIGRSLRDVRIGPSPDLAEGAAPRGRHALDLERRRRDQLRDARARQPAARVRPRGAAGGGIVVRRADAGEEIRTLDGTLRTLTPDDLVIADEERAIALAGIMGGEETEVSEATTLRPARGGELRARRDPAQLRAARAAQRGLEPVGEGRRPARRRGRRRPGHAADRRARPVHAGRATPTSAPSCRRAPRSRCDPSGRAR